MKMWRLPDSNRPPSDCEPDALPDELNPHDIYVAKLQKKRNLTIEISYLFLLLLRAVILLINKKNKLTKQWK